MMNTALTPAAQGLLLLMLANGTPVIAKKLLGNRLAMPLDLGLRWPDGRAVFGTSKTMRGIALAVLTTGLGAWLIGLDWRTGMLFAGLAMLGDLFSSFVKRRLGYPPSARATGLDQIPESLFPLLGCAGALGLTPAGIALGVAGFFIGEIALSRVLYRWHLRDRPY